MDESTKEPDASAGPVGRRPARRRDWRWWVGSTGRMLIVVGLLLLGFVAYQLWGTGIQHARAQSSLETAFDRQLSSTVPATVPTTTTAAAPSSTTAPATTVAPTTAPPITAPPRPVFADGDPVARLEIPRMGLDEIVVAGVGVDDLKKGPGHYPQTPLPGEPGNAAIAGHRTTYGAPFLDIDNLQPGDEIIATTYAGRFVYTVTDSVVVSPSDVSVLDNTPDDRITLTSCDPKYSATNRIIVTAAFDPASSSPIAAPSPPDSTPPVTSPPDTTPDGPVVIVSVANTAAVPSTVAPTPGLNVDDSFQQGWFSDAGAWPQVLAWALGCTGVVVAGWWLGRRTHRWIGWLAGAVPFLVLLYFFYENVNRLLPPNI
jgi:sortase A